MSSVVSKYLIIIVLLVVVVFQLYLYQESLKREQFLQHQIGHLQRQVVDMEKELVVVKAMVLELNEGSLDAMVDDANEAIISGWEALIDVVNKELQNARDSLRADDQPKTQTSPRTDPSLSSRKIPT